MTRAGRLAGRIGLPLFGGALVGCSLPPVSFWPLGVLGMAAVVVSLKGRSLRGRLAAGLWAGIGQFAVGVAWAIQFNAAGYVVLVIVESLIVAVGAGLVPPSGPLRVPAAAAAFTLAEWVRESWPFGGLPLGSAALGQVGGPLQFAARLGGPLLVVFVLALSGGAVGELVLAGTRRRDGGSPASLFPSLSYLVAAGALAGAGAVTGPATAAGAPRLRVAIVQGGGQRGLSQLQVPPSRVFEAALSETARITGRPSLIVWPEDVVAMGPTRFVGSRAEALLAGIARRRHSTLVAGVTEDVGATRFRNEVVALSPSGRLVATFEKVHRVPFGEYVPYRSFFSHFANLRDIPRDAIAGHGSGMIATPAGRFAVLVSYEVFFADRGRSGVRAGGRLILVPTNTSSYSSSQAPSQEIAASRLQAIEEGRYLLQAAPTGYSAVISSSGAVLQRTALSTPAVLEASVPLLSTPTPFEESGELPVLAAGAALVLLAWLVRSAPRRSGGRDEADRRRAKTLSA